MRRQQAKSIIVGLDKLSECIDELSDKIEKLDDIEEQKRLRRIVGPVLAAHFDLLEAVIAQFPDLAPKEDDGPDQ